LVPATNGLGAPPIVHGGIVYQVTDNYQVFALNAGTGQLVWSFQAPLQDEMYTQHTHAITYYDGMVWMSVPGHGYYDELGLDAITGTVKANITDIAKNVVGQRYEPENGVYTPNVNKGFYDPEWPPVFYKDIMMTVADAPDSITRGFNSAYNITSGKLLWTWYAVPPAPNCDPNWDFEDLVTLGNGTTVNYGQPPGNITPFKGDWGTDCNDNGGGGIVENAAVDNQTGIVYGATLGNYPSGYAGGRPGPDLYANSVVALNMTNGKMLWFYDPEPHEQLGDQDCEWGTTITVVNGQKEVVAQCHEYLYGLDAATGKLLWSYDPLNNKATGTNPTPNPNTGLNMGNQMNMTLPYPYASAPYNGKYLQNVTVGETLAAYDGKETVFTWFNNNGLGADALPENCALGPPKNTTLVPYRYFDVTIGEQLCTPSQTQTLPEWSVVAAINESSGNIEWSHLYPDIQHRGGLTYSNGMLFATTNDGHLRVYNAATGDVLMDRYMGTVDLGNNPTLGANAQGQMMLFLPSGSSGATVTTVPNSPGMLLGLALTSPSSSSSVSSSSVSNGGSTTTTGAPGSGSSTTTTVTNTVTSTTGSSGVSMPIFYAVVAVAVIFIFVSGVLATRRRGVPETH
jgi:outer membrane protein assembly factor BamB